MQSLDALTLKVLLQEARPFLLKRKVDRIVQFGRDEIALALRCQTGTSNLLLSAHASFGRICLIDSLPKTKGGNPPGFCMLLRKHLSAASVVAVEQMPGERVVDIVFAARDELGQQSHKVLTAEIMGRHSNLVFWDKPSMRILGASHLVTKEMSRRREILPGREYARPPGMDKPNIFAVSARQFNNLFEARPDPEQALAEWLIGSFSGLGSHLAEELADGLSQAQSVTEAGLWKRIAEIQGDFPGQAAMRSDRAAYTLTAWSGNKKNWQEFLSANQMVEEYFRYQESRQHFQQLKDSLCQELNRRLSRLRLSQQTALKYLETAPGNACHKKFGDLILAHIAQIRAGDNQLVCDDLIEPGGGQVVIPLDSNLGAAANAERYYRLFSKGQSRQKMADSAANFASAQISTLERQLQLLQSSTELSELERMKESILPARLPAGAAGTKNKKKSKLLQITSSDGWTIYLGRNRQENDELISRLAKPHDIWMHILGHSGAHVLIKVPSTKQDPPAATLDEAARAAVRFSKRMSGGKVKVVYTQCRHVHKIAKSKPGLVRYENERTLEVDAPGLLKEAQG